MFKKPERREVPQELSHFSIASTSSESLQDNDYRPTIKRTSIRNQNYGKTLPKMVATSSQSQKEIGTPLTNRSYSWKTLPLLSSSDEEEL